MSAFLCSTFHTVVCAMVLLTPTHGAAPSAAAVRPYASALRKVNNRALACRYGDKPEYLPRDISAAVINAAAWLEQASGNDIAAVCHCLQYQCSEGDAPSMREWSFIDELTKRADTLGDYCKSSVWSI